MGTPKVGLHLAIFRVLVRLEGNNELVKQADLQVRIIAVL